MLKCCGQPANLLLLLLFFLRVAAVRRDRISGSSTTMIRRVICATRTYTLDSRSAPSLIQIRIKASKTAPSDRCNAGDWQNEGTCCKYFLVEPASPASNNLLPVWTR